MLPLSLNLHLITFMSVFTQRIVSFPQMLISSVFLVLLLPQVVLWDISAHVTHLQGTQPGKKASVNTDTFVSARIFSLICAVLIQKYTVFCICPGVLHVVSVTVILWLVVMSAWFIQVRVLSLSKHATYLL